MQWSGLWPILALVVVVVGVLLVVRSLRRNSINASAEDLGIKTKYGLPIIAREDRNLSEHYLKKSEIAIENVEQEDALSDMAAVMADTPVMQPLSNNNDGHYTYDSHNQNEIHTPTQNALQGDNQQINPAKQPDDKEQVLAIDDDAYLTGDTDCSEQASPCAVYSPGEHFEKDSPVVDRHLGECLACDKNNDPLLGATEVVDITIVPRNSFAGLPGKKVLEIARAYGMKYGAMSLFHRHENEDGTGDLWFSMTGLGHGGVCAFDLNSLPEDHFVGLALFLPLPHPCVLRGFDSMVSVANMIAQDLEADMLDGSGNLLDDMHCAKLRSIIAEYS